MAPYDVIILGGGPAGSLTASLIRRQDPSRRVLVLERERFPRHHVGESTIPSWATVLDRAGVLAKIEASPAIRKVGGRFFWGIVEDESWTIDFRDPHRHEARRGGFHVDRAVFDQVLLDHARSLGVEAHEESQVKAVDRIEGGFRVTWLRQGREEQAECSYVVDASGQARVLSRLWNIGVVRFDGMNNFAVYGYWKGSKRAGHGAPLGEGERWTTITTSEDGWVWHIPIAPDLVSVGLVTEAESIPAGGAAELERFYLRNVLRCAKVGELLEGAELDRHPLAPSRLMVVRDWSYRCEQVCGPGFFMVGDAALFVDPILSTGLLITTNGASMAANALHTLWNDARVDVPLLLESYQAMYTDIGLSFHRLAQIWYSRNFKCGTWHWEAKRQRLRTGRDPSAETDAQAFYHLCIGSFANPLEGASQNPLEPADTEHPAARVIGSHLFTDAERAGAADPGTLSGDDPEEDLRQTLRAQSDRRLHALLGRRLALRGCVWSRAEGYFTDRNLPRWVRVRYVEVRPDGAADSFDRVVFPALDWLPEGLLPLLDGAQTLRDVLHRACSTAAPGSSLHRHRLETLSRQVLQLDLRGWLQGDEEPGPVTPAG